MPNNSQPFFINNNNKPYPGSSSTQAATNSNNPSKATYPINANSVRAPSSGPNPMNSNYHQIQQQQHQQQQHQYNNYNNHRKNSMSPPALVSQGNANMRGAPYQISPQQINNHYPNGNSNNQYHGHFI